MKLLRETIRRLILEDAFDVEGPCVKMLEAMQSSSPDFAMTPDIQITYERSQYTFEYYVAKNCMYKINLNIDSDNAIFIESIEVVGAEYNDACEGQGYASEMMFSLLSLADEHDVQLSLVTGAFNKVYDDRRPDDASLTSWYKRLGFVDSPRGDGTLVYNFH